MSDVKTDEPVTIRPLDTSAHAMDGGTFVTNLSSDLDIFEAAIAEYGDPRIALHDEPCLGGAGIKGWKSLHYLGPVPGGGAWGGVDLSPFWRVVDRLRGKDV